MKVVVTGGSGQLGSLVLQRLVDSRTVERIVSLDLVPPQVESPKLEHRIADMRDPGLERHVEGADALVHLAFIVVKRTPKEIRQAVNVEGSKRLFEAAAAHGVPRIVYSSSIAAYGVVDGHPTPIVESTPRKRTFYLPYADDKYEVEEYLDRFEEDHAETAVVRLRPGIIVGRRMAHDGPRFSKMRFWPVVSEARGGIVWDEDVADAVMLGLQKNVRGAFNLVADEPLSGAAIARQMGVRPLKVPKAALVVVEKIGQRMRGVDIDPGWLRTGSVEMIVSSEKAKRELGWTPEYPTTAEVAAAFGKSLRTGSPSGRASLPGFFRGFAARLHVTKGK